MENDSACVQCSAGRCFVAFHVTCAQAANVVFETCDWPMLVKISCDKHNENTNYKVFTSVCIRTLVFIYRDYKEFRSDQYLFL